MNSLIISVVIVPGVVAFLLFLVFTYLHEQSRQPYFRAWQIGWGAFTLHYALDAWGALEKPTALSSFLTSLLLVVVAVSIFVSTRLMKRMTGPERRKSFRLRWYEIAVILAGAVLAYWNLRARMVDGVFRADTAINPHYRMEIGLAIVLLYCSLYFYRSAQRKNSVAFTLLALSLAFWAVLMAFGQLRGPLLDMVGTADHMLGPVPQMLLGIAMVMVLFENERNAAQENALAFSRLEVNPKQLLSAEDLTLTMQSILDRLVAPLPSDEALICVAERWRALLPSVQRGFSPEFLNEFEKTGAGEYIGELAYRRGGYVTFHNLPEMPEPLPAFPGGRFEHLRRLMGEQEVRSITAVSLQTREHNFGVLLFPQVESRILGSSNVRLLIGLSLQIGLTLENYVVMHDAQRRSKEYALLTQIGQAISSRLDQDEVLRAIQKELGQIFDTTNFYIAFQEGDNLHFELEVEKGTILPKRARKFSNGLTEYVIRTAQPLLIRSDLDKAFERLGLTIISEKPLKCFCAVPILFGGKPEGVMAAISTEREYVFEERDLEVLQTAAGQVSVAIENARLFSEEQHRSRHLAFLNSISKTAISSEDAEQMMAEIVGHIQRNFRFDHIGIGILDYATKDIEIKAEAGTTAGALGKRIPLGTGILGRVARTGETALVQTTGEGQLQGVLSDSRAVLCIPIAYGDSLLGVLNVESREQGAFAPQDVLIMNTLADLLATALHNSFVFQKLQQQSITDGLTGIKTRRFFWEALSSEWKRASRSGRPFSIVLLDLDKFKEVNDTLGHLEGDLVLARVGRLLEQKCRQSNVVARYGGDEFIILMPETGMEQAQILAERLRLWLVTDPMLAEHQITGSFGVASFPVHGFSAEDIIRVADAGMYVSKRAGANRVSVAEQFTDDAVGASQRLLVSGYIEGFLQREHNGDEQLEELVTTLKKLCGGDEDCNLQVLRESIEALAHMAESREMYGAGHGDLVGKYCEIMGRALRMTAEEISDLVYAARIHDVGKIFVEERILNKPGPLSEEEFTRLKMHARLGGEVVRAVPHSELQAAIASHHEAFDGSGYPAGLRGEEIPLWGRIIAIADSYANMVSERSYSASKSSEQALAELGKLSGTRLDGMLVRILIRELKAEKASPNLQ